MNKKILIFFAILALTLGLVACEDNNGGGGNDRVDVESVEILNTETTLEPGAHTLEGRALPAGSNQQFRFTVVGVVEGVSIDGSTLNISVNALDGLEFTVRITSLYDPTISATKVFTVSNNVESTLIANEDDLFAIFDDENHLNGRYLLTADIVLTKDWTPIGFPDFEDDDGVTHPGSPFNGLFDGGGYKISGINFDDNTFFHAGFFAQISSSGVVRNVEFEGYLKGEVWSGGVAGINYGEITNVISRIEVVTQKQAAGALVSANYGTISYSYALAPVKSLTKTNNETDTASGALVNNNVGNMIHVYGDRDMMLTSNYLSNNAVNTKNPDRMLSTAQMKTASTWADFDTDVWHIEDGLYPILKHDNYVIPEKEIALSITNVESGLDLEEVTELQILASVINGDPSVELSYALEESVLGVSMDDDGLITFNSELVVHNSTFTVIVTYSETVKATKTFTILYNPLPEGDIVISTEAELRALAAATKESILAKTYVLGADIILTNWFNTSIGSIDLPFTGIFDGNGHTISGFRGGDEKTDFGFFGVIAEGAIVRNLNLLDDNDDKGLYVGNGSATLAATNYGLIENVYVEVKIGGTGQWAAALVANNHGTINNVVVRSKISINDDATDIGPVIIDNEDGVISNVLVDKTYTNITTFFHNSEDNLSALLTDAEMKLAQNYANFDGDLWNIVDGEIPMLKPQELGEQVVVITTAIEFAALAASTDPAVLGKNYALGNDIDLGELETIPKIGRHPDEDEGILGNPFTGTFDGKGYTLTLYKEAVGYLATDALFGYIGETGVVKNLKLTGYIEVSSWSAILVMHNEGLVTDVIIDVIEYNVGANAGAIAVHNHGAINNVIVTGNVMADGGTVGVLVNNFGTVSNIFVDSEKFSSDNVVARGDVKELAGVFFKTTAEMKTATTFDALDSDIWNIVEGEYPTLRKPQ